MNIKEILKKYISGKQPAKVDKLEPAVSVPDNKELAAASLFLAETTKADADLLAKITKESANLLAEETKASASLLAEETKSSAEEIRKSNEAYIGWTKWMTVTLITVGFIQIILTIIPLFRSTK